MIRARYIGSVAALLLLFQGCLYDPDSPCGKNQYYENENCVCNAGMILDEAQTGCRACGKHQYAAGTLCICDDGYKRETTDGECEALPDAFGRECDPKTNPCDDPTYSFCYVPDKGTPYCTLQGCISNEECGGHYGCESRTFPTFCAKYPVGLGDSCATDTDCTGPEANHCETYRAKVCMVEGCVGPEVTCYAGAHCCDYSALGVPTSLCVPPESFEDGKCPIGGALVED